MLMDCICVSTAVVRPQCRMQQIIKMHDFRQYLKYYIRAFIHSRYFYSASSNPLLLRGAPSHSIYTVLELTRQSTTENCEWRTCPRSLPMWQLEWHLNRQPFGRKAPNLPWATTPHKRSVSMPARYQWLRPCYSGICVTSSCDKVRIWCTSLFVFHIYSKYLTRPNLSLPWLQNVIDGVWWNGHGGFMTSRQFPHSYKKLKFWIS